MKETGRTGSIKLGFFSVSHAKSSVLLLGQGKNSHQMIRINFSLGGYTLDLKSLFFLSSPPCHPPNCFKATQTMCYYITCLFFSSPGGDPPDPPCPNFKLQGWTTSVRSDRFWTDFGPTRRPAFRNTNIFSNLSWWLRAAL